MTDNIRTNEKPVKGRNPVAEVSDEEGRNGVSEGIKRTAPTLDRLESGQVDILLQSNDQLNQLFCTKTDEAAELILRSALNALGQNAEGYLELMPAMAVEMEPRDAVEAMLVTQMTATHVAISSMSLKMNHAKSIEALEVYERSMTRLSRTFLAQIEGFKKYRAKAQQTVRVERVEVKDGGQAVVGDVNYRRGDDGKK